MKADMIKGLSRCLADTYIIYLNTQKCHWNVEGPNFSSLHLMFESQYKSLAEFIDVLAERIRALGAYAPGSFKEFEALSSVPPLEALEISSTQMIKTLSAGYEELIKSIGSGIKKSEEAGDAGTADILLSQAGFHEKTKWMLESTIKGMPR